MTNRSRLRAIMKTRGLTSRDVAELTHRAPGTVRQYLCGALETPDDFLELLEFKLGMRGGATSGPARSATADHGQDSCACGDEKTTTTRGR